MRILHTSSDPFFSPNNKTARRIHRPEAARTQTRQAAEKGALADRLRAGFKAMLAALPKKKPFAPSGKEPRKAYLIAALGTALGISLLVVSMTAFQESAWNRVNLGEFTMPEDLRISELLLLSISAVESGKDELPPELPLTLKTSVYRISKNDTLDAIAKKFGVRMDTLISLNAIADVRRLQSGATLKIPNIDGVLHTVRKGESIGGIASSYKVDLLDIVDANNLASQVIQPNQSLFIPGAKLQSSQLKRALGTFISWPIKGRISSNFGYRTSPFSGVRQFHNGLDIVGPANLSIHPAMEGRVAETGYSAIFGNFVIVTHYDNYQTLYGHLNKISVKEGQNVTQSTVLGLLGYTGMSTGPHLHFGVFKRGLAQDPLKFLGK